MSAKTGFAPRELTALPVATKVNGGRSTSSPAPTPHARKAKIRASVPEATPTPLATPQSLAISSSSAAPSRPRINCCDAITRSTAVRTSAPIAEYCADKSSCGTGSSREVILGCEVMALWRFSIRHLRLGLGQCSDARDLQMQEQPQNKRQDGLKSALQTPIQTQ